MHLTIQYGVFVCHQFNICKNYVGSVYVGGYGDMKEMGIYVFRELCPVRFLVVDAGSSVLL